MNISSLNWVENSCYTIQKIVKNISNHKEIKASSEQEKNF